MSRITGRTRVWAILADPIGHVRTPQHLNRIMQERGVDGVMVPLHVPAADLARVVDGLRGMANFGGFIATVPHKVAVAALCDEATALARHVGAVNAVRREADGRLVGDMLDGAAFVRGLREAGFDPLGRRVYLAGAGGAARAIAFALAQAGAAHLTLHNRTAARSEELRLQLASFQPGTPVVIGSRNPAGHDLAINATSLGLHHDDPLPFEAAALHAGQLVAEVIMEPERTPLMVEAERRGCRTHPGLPMLTSQTSLMADFLGMADRTGPVRA